MLTLVGRKLCRELKHENIIGLNEVLIDPLDRSIYMAFDYAEHDLLVGSGDVPVATHSKTLSLLS